MSELNVGVRELKTRLSEYLGKVKEGQTIIITEHGKPVGRLLPIEPSLEQRMEMLRNAGFVAWDGRKLEPIRQPVKNRSDQQVSDLLVDMRA